MRAGRQLSRGVNRSRRRKFADGAHCLRPVLTCRLLWGRLVEGGVNPGCWERWCHVWPRGHYLHMELSGKSREDTRGGLKTAYKGGSTFVCVVFRGWAQLRVVCGLGFVWLAQPSCTNGGTTQASLSAHPDTPGAKRGMLELERCLCRPMTVTELDSMDLFKNGSPSEILETL